MAPNFVDWPRDGSARYALRVASPPHKLRIQVPKDHLVRLPSEIPEGPAELIVIPGAGSPAGAARRAAFGRYDASSIQVPDDFDAPLSDDVLARFEDRSASTR